MLIMTSLQFIQPLRAKGNMYLYLENDQMRKLLKLTHRTSLMEALKEVLGLSELVLIPWWRRRL